MDDMRNDAVPRRSTLALHENVWLTNSFYCRRRKNALTEFDSTAASNSRIMSCTWQATGVHTARARRSSIPEPCEVPRITTDHRSVSHGLRHVTRCGLSDRGSGHWILDVEVARALSELSSRRMENSQWVRTDTFCSKLSRPLSAATPCRHRLSNYRLSGRAVNKVPGLSLSATNSMMRRRAAQLWR